MKVTINFSEAELTPALQEHLEKGTAVQAYIKAALRFFNDVLRVATKDNAFGYGEKFRFATYNIVMDPEKYLNTGAGNDDDE